MIKIYKNLVYRVIPIILPPRTHQYSDPTAVPREQAWILSGLIAAVQGSTIGQKYKGIYNIFSKTFSCKITNHTPTAGLHHYSDPMVIPGEQAWLITRPFAETHGSSHLLGRKYNGISNILHFILWKCGWPIDIMHTAWCIQIWEVRVTISFPDQSQWDMDSSYHVYTQITQPIEV